MSELPLQVGEIIGGKYRLGERLGSGGMGDVFAAHHIQLDDKVAIKFMRAEGLDDPQTVARFAREARAAVKIKGEHVVRVTDVGELDNGIPYMVMEYLDGIDLARWLQERGVLPVEQAVGFVLQAAEAVAEAHANGIIHRDLKPANLFVITRRDGTESVKVLDFGISKIQESGTDLTMTAVMMGSPYHMAPEQMRSSRHADGRSDVWALGTVLYTLLTGCPPFAADTMAELMHRTLFEQPAPVRSRRPEVAARLERVLERCMEKDPGARFQTIPALAEALAEFSPDWSRPSLQRIAAVTGTAPLAPPAPLPSAIAANTAPQPHGSTLAAWGATAAASKSKVAFGLGFFALAALAALTLWLRTPGATFEQGPASASVETASASAPAARDSAEEIPVLGGAAAVVPSAAAAPEPAPTVQVAASASAAHVPTVAPAPPTAQATKPTLAPSKTITKPKAPQPATKKPATNSSRAPSGNSKADIDSLIDQRH